MITNKDISTPLGAIYAYVKPRMRCRKMQNIILRLGELGGEILSLSPLKPSPPGFDILWIKIFSEFDELDDIQGRRSRIWHPFFDLYRVTQALMSIILLALQTKAFLNNLGKSLNTWKTIKYGNDSNDSKIKNWTCKIDAAN